MIGPLRVLAHQGSRPRARLVLGLLLAAGWLATLGTNVLLAFPMHTPAWFLWHPLLLPFRPSVRTDAAGWLLTLQWWAWLAALAAIVAWLRRPRWLLLLALILVAGIPPMGMLLDTGARWAVAGVAGLLAWRKAARAAMLLISVAVLAPPLAASAVVTGYGLRVGGSPGLLAAALGVGALLAAWALVADRDGPVLLPPIALITLTLTALATSPAARAHHDDPPAAGACANLDVTILQAFPETPESPLWSIADHPEGLVVGGNDHLWTLDETGAIRGQVHSRCGRPFALATLGSRVVGTFQCGVLAWLPDGDTEAWFQEGGFDEPMHIVALDGAVLAGSNQFPVAIRADGDRVDLRYYGRPSGLNLFGISRTRARVFVWDGSTISQIDPGTLDPVRTQSFDSPDRAITVAGGGRLLARSLPLSKAVEIVDGDSFQAIGTIDVGFSARYLAIDPADQTLAAVDFLSDSLVVHSIRDGSRLGTYRVGPRPRGIQWSEHRGAFVGVSACGAFSL